MNKIHFEYGMCVIYCSKGSLDLPMSL